MHKTIFEAHRKNYAKTQIAIPSKVDNPLLHSLPALFFPFNFLHKPRM